LPEQNETALIAELARDAIQQVAPQELWRFRAASQTYFDDPDQALIPETDKDEMLGFGAGQQVALMTPIALAMATQMVKFVVEEVASSVKAESPSVIQRYVRMIFGKVAPQVDDAQTKEESSTTVAAPVSLTSEQLARVRQVALDTAHRLNLADDRAALLADSLVGGLVVQPEKP
jgi:hypothetical protein